MTVIHAQGVAALIEPWVVHKWTQWPSESARFRAALASAQKGAVERWCRWVREKRSEPWFGAAKALEELEKVCHASGPVGPPESPELAELARRIRELESEIPTDEAEQAGPVMAEIMARIEPLQERRNALLREERERL